MKYFNERKTIVRIIYATESNQSTVYLKCNLTETSGNFFLKKMKGTDDIALLKRK